MLVRLSSTLVSNIEFLWGDLGANRSGMGPHKHKKPYLRSYHHKLERMFPQNPFLMSLVLIEIGARGRRRSRGFKV